MVEVLSVCPDCGEGGMSVDRIDDFCEFHEAEIRMALIQRGFQADLDIDDEERALRFISGDKDALSDMKYRLVMGAMSVFGGERVVQNKGCPVCTFTNIIEMSADEVAIDQRKVN